MSWLRIEGRMPSHPKVAPLSDAAFRVHVTTLAWCVEHGTNGVVPRGVPATLTAAPRGKRMGAVIDELVTARLWVPANDEAGGWEIHDFLAFNPTAEKQAAAQSRHSAARREAGQRGAAARWSNGKPDGKPDGKRDGKLPSLPLATGWQTDASDSDSDSDSEEEDPRSLVPQGGTGAPAESKTSEAIDEVYAAFVAAKKRWKPTSRPAPKLVDPKLRKAVKLLLASGRSVADLKLACEGLFLSPHHLGQNDRSTEYLDFEYVATKPKNIDAFVSLAEDAGRGGVAASTSPRGSLRDVPTAEELAAVDRAAVQRMLAERVGALTAKMTPTLPLLPEEVGQ